ncbi:MULTISPECIES: hypothetical protein [Bacillus cereus group]|uniref:hypothetical protein n=1 Tax=Bacillus cereus group TaxID=86661 RepID=UPI0006A7FB4F|nr:MULTISPECIES: hypothetical protein [Bacillus cereus group]MBJ7935613.1 hypothetical protein [Bacillus cereus]CUB50831.1 hypothetical protein BN2127_JRS10_00348 [Bacillus subtilis]
MELASAYINMRINNIYTEIEELFLPSFEKISYNSPLYKREMEIQTIKKDKVTKEIKKLHEQYILESIESSFRKYVIG